MCLRSCRRGAESAGQAMYNIDVLFAGYKSCMDSLTALMKQGIVIFHTNIFTLQEKRK